MNSFKDQIVWITGASSGIGEATAIALSNQGAKVILSSRKRDQLEQAALKCKGETYVLPLDLSDSSNFDTIVKEAIKAFGSIDMLINNGGISQRSTAAETALEVDRKVMEINYFGNIALTKVLLPHFRQKKSGRIVVISSLSGKFGFFLRSAYAASKFALVGFYESLRLEEEKNNLKVHLVFPGFIRTNISKNAIDAQGKQHGEMDNNQDQGISAEECATRLIKGIQKEKRDIYIGGKEMMSLKIQRFFPNLFHKVIKKQSAT
ncbi:MAG: SDR family oxidoreductase [Flavobacteriales bacterium]|nr:SDR family oxidoreductase [Flavobacteriales bacterium]